MKKYRRPLIIGLILALIGGILYFGVTWVAPYAIIVPLRVDPAQHAEKYNHPYHPSQLGLNYDTLDIVVDDTLNLAGYWIKPQNEDSMVGTVIFLHGISSVKEVFLDFAAYLSERNLGSALIDLRAHGKSEGQFNTYGYREKKDISQVAHYLKKEKANLPVAVWGNSLGGAIAYQTLAYDSLVDVGVIQSTFSHLPQIVEEYARRILGVKIPGLAPYALEKASRIADFPGKNISPAEACKSISQPVYVMHGDQDENIDIAYGRLNYNRIPHQNKVWYVVEGADHYDLPNKASRHVDEVVIPWVIEQMKMR